MLLNCDGGENSWEFFWWQGGQIRKSILNIHWKDWCWSLSCRILATYCYDLTHWKRPFAGKDWRQIRRGQQRMRWLDNVLDFNGCEFEQTSGDSKGQGSLVCCSSWGHKESDVTEWLNNNNVSSSPRRTENYFTLQQDNEYHILTWNP